ncbi:uncharacterized protein GGS22DRAFT_5604 [Annulohypoxylon maeteangense]|uniref:uncharacterized protein n=1 Tax=Annulohypoxylon maeteangense TaxID=1927788 RepID=UPI00200806BD|nr:uncharacterized protein GGS22DRAFT_5604 [Annulohypoxylon maeteangense]KAI0889889.1 hypothetical protein GGS22DRAFT_5604 [Annulohypoxylon maeteangense]
MTTNESEPHAPIMAAPEYRFNIDIIICYVLFSPYASAKQPYPSSVSRRIEDLYRTRANSFSCFNARWINLRKVHFRVSPRCNRLSRFQSLFRVERFDWSVWLGCKPHLPIFLSSPSRMNETIVGLVGVRIFILYIFPRFTRRRFIFVLFLLALVMRLLCLPRRI